MYRKRTKQERGVQSLCSEVRTSLISHDRQWGQLVKVKKSDKFGISRKGRFKKKYTLKIRGSMARI